MLNYTLKDNLFQVPGKMLSFSWHANGGKNARMPWQVAIDRLREASQKGDGVMNLSFWPYNFATHCWIIIIPVLQQ